MLTAQLLDIGACFAGDQARLVPGDVVNTRLYSWTDVSVCDHITQATEERVAVAIASMYTHIDVHAGRLLGCGIPLQIVCDGVAHALCMSAHTGCTLHVIADG